MQQFIHIMHPELRSANNFNPKIEYYFCKFLTQSDIDNFHSTCPWFDPIEFEIKPGEEWVIAYMSQEDASPLIRKIDPSQFIRSIDKKLEVWNSVKNNAQMFFN